MSAKTPSPELTRFLKDTYPRGTRVRLRETTDPYTELGPGDIGTVTMVDDLGTVHVAWDRGSSLGLVFGDDQFEKAEEGR